MLPRQREVSIAGLGATKLRLTGVVRAELNPDDASMTFFNSKGGYYRVTEGGLQHSCASLPGLSPKRID